MLESLRIENLILIRKAEIHFGKGLNILTGETGAGKSAILSAIHLLSGEKADPQMLRDPAKPAIIEGEIRFKNLDADPDLLGEKQLLCTLRREILPSGKSRAFFNDRLVSATELKRLTSQIMEFADQNGAREILSPASQRALLDQWAGIDTAELSRSYERQQAAASELTRLRIEKEKAHLATALILEQIAAIEEVSWKEEEESQLREDHARYARASENSLALSAIQAELSELSLPSVLRKIATRIPEQSLPLLQEAATLFSSASVEILEAERLLDRAAGEFDPDPRRLDGIEERIAQIEKIKRKFGKTYEEVQARLLSLKSDLAAFETIDEKISLLEKEFSRLSEENLKTAAAFSRLRREKSISLQKALLQEIRSLHLPHAEIQIALAEKPLGADGCDTVRFLFSANPGQPLLPLEECASGGEQSRVFFALKSILSAKEERSCLVLDEIDSNVGGVAASILGEKLKALGEKRQIICITHFAQAAQHAAHHLLVEKTSSASDAETTVRLLSEKERQSEYTRMTGGRKF